MHFSEEDERICSRASYKTPLEEPSRSKLVRQEQQRQEECGLTELVHSPPGDDGRPTHVVVSGVGGQAGRQHFLPHLDSVVQPSGDDGQVSTRVSWDKMFLYCTTWVIVLYECDVIFYSG